MPWNPRRVRQTDLPHRPHRNVSMTAVFVAIVLAAISASCSSSAQPDGVRYTTSNNSRAAPPEVTAWIERVTGKTISYMVNKSCYVCGNRGLWRITERDGVVISAASLDGQAVSPTFPPPLLTEALAVASRASRVSDVKSTDSAISFSVDPDPAIVDDEFGYEAYEITFES